MLLEARERMDAMRSCHHLFSSDITCSDGDSTTRLQSVQSINSVRDNI